MKTLGRKRSTEPDEWSDDWVRRKTRVISTRLASGLGSRAPPARTQEGETKNLNIDMVNMRGGRRKNEDERGLSSNLATGGGVGVIWGSAVFAIAVGTSAPN